jgi:hypothetical protein
MVSELPSAFEGLMCCPRTRRAAARHSPGELTLQLGHADQHDYSWYGRKRAGGHASLPYGRGRSVASGTDNRGAVHVDTINTFGVSAGHFASFHVVSRSQIQRLRSSR